MPASVRRWGPGLEQVLVGAALVVTGAGALLSDGVRGASSAGGAVAGLALGLLVALGVELCWASSVTVDGGSVLVRNPLRMIEVPCARVAGVVAGRHLSLQLDDERSIRVWGFWRSNLRVALGGRGRLDRVADEIGHAVSDAAPSPPGAARRVHVVPPHPLSVVVVLLAIGLGALG